MATWWERGGEMPSIEERMAYLEGTVSAHTHVFTDARTEQTELRADMNRQFADVRSEIAELRGDMHQRFALVDNRLIWLFGTQISTLLAVIAALAGASYR